MNILIVSATENEILMFKKYIFENKKTVIFIKQKANIDFLITDVGMLFTTYKLTKELNKKKYDLIINAGIAGAFNKNLKLGEVVNIKQQTFGDFGVDDNSVFKSMFDINLIDKNKFPFTDGKITNNYNIDFINNLKQVNGITVNTVSGDNNKIIKLTDKFNTDIETMESIAIFYICKIEKINFIEIRAISNYVENRDKSKWEIELAIKNLNNFLINIFKH